MLLSLKTTARWELVCWETAECLSAAPRCVAGPRPGSARRSSGRSLERPHGGDHSPEPTGALPLWPSAPCSPAEDCKRHRVFKCTPVGKWLNSNAVRSGTGSRFWFRKTHSSSVMQYENQHAAAKYFTSWNKGCKQTYLPGYLLGITTWWITCPGNEKRQQRTFDFDYWLRAKAANAVVSSQPTVVKWIFNTKLLFLSAGRRPELQSPLPGSFARTSWFRLKVVVVIF